MDKYLYWLDNVPRLGRHAKICLMSAFKSGEEIYHTSDAYLKYILEEGKAKTLQASKTSWDLDGEYERLQEKGIRMVNIVDEQFPEKLLKLPDPPFCVYYLGELPDEKIPSVAIIGARECSEYGQYIAMELGKCLGDNHIQVISGMAKGIDGISQWTALEAGGTSFGIMGCGVDICYPRSNQKVYDRLLVSGGILSEYTPGTQPVGRLFPPRNRIVSGLADVLVVIEARHKSGTSITVEMALEQGKDIYAVPGRVTDRLSDGCNKMLKEGAHVFLSPQDFLQEMQQLVPDKMNYIMQLKRKCMNQGSGYAENREKKEAVDYAGTICTDVQTVSRQTVNHVAGNSLADIADIEKILSVLDFYPQYVDSIAERLMRQYQRRLPTAKLNTLLIQLCLFDRVKQESPGWFIKI